MLKKPNVYNTPAQNKNIEGYTGWDQHKFIVRLNWQNTQRPTH